MTRLLLGALALSGLVPLLGCGPIEYVRRTSGGATAALAEARRVRADVWAPYEFTMAAAYAAKSRELAGHARFETAVAYGRRAEELAAKAAAVAEVRERRGGRPGEVRAAETGRGAPR